MARMVRKQVYIEERHEAALKRLAARRGVAEAEIVRDAIDRAEAAVEPARRPDPAAWDEFAAFLNKLRRRPAAAPGPRRWSRDDLYAERIRGRRGAD